MRGTNTQKLRIEENKLGGKIVCAGERERDEMTNQPPSPPLDGRADRWVAMYTTEVMVSVKDHDLERRSGCDG